MQQSSTNAVALSGITASRVAPGMSCFAWNKDGSKIAICPNTNEIWVYKTNNSPNDSTKWERIQVLKEVI